MTHCPGPQGPERLPESVGDSREEEQRVSSQPPPRPCPPTPLLCPQLLRGLECGTGLRVSQGFQERWPGHDSARVPEPRCGGVTPAI